LAQDKVTEAKKVKCDPATDRRKWQQDGSRSEWRQVHFTHSGYDPPCLSARRHQAALLGTEASGHSLLLFHSRLAELQCGLHIFRSVDRL